MKKLSSRYWAILFLLCVVMMPAVATTVSIQLVQIGSTHPNNQASSSLLEDGILDLMFSQGIIASTFPIISGEQKIDTNVSKTIGFAKEGSSQILAQVSVYFDTSQSLAPERVLLSNIKYVEWSLYETKDGKKIATGTEKPDMLIKTDDTEKGINSFGKQIAQKITKAIITNQ